ncbi:unnamed protein product [Cylindrotheca closterium]|uniref:Uncharacterized protein n=1 Tax=Cylindrotheca closterium TaxID=2856 RepID=A0AAD2G4M7_9STRA|nr:unnamed protein product [Cylindrotheca closterium]
MEADDSDEFPAQLPEPQDLGEEPHSHDQEILNIVKLIEQLEASSERRHYDDDVPKEIALDNPTEGGEGSESNIRIEDQINNGGGVESQQVRQQAPGQEQRHEAGQQPQQPQQDQEEQGQPPEANLHPFLLNENRPDEDEIVELQIRQTTEIIAQSLARYRAQGVPEDDLELVLIPHSAGGNFLSRGAWFGAFILSSVVLLFTLQMQAMFGRTVVVDVTFDDLMYELLEIRHFSSQVQQCHKDKNSTTTMEDDAFPASPFSIEGNDCSNGVLHIPALHVLRDPSLHPQSNRLMRYRQGLNLTWRMPCQTTNRALLTPQECSALDEMEGVCTINKKDDAMCFRGVHDNIVSDKEVDATLNFAKELLKDGSDHFDVYLASKLEEKLPEVVKKLRNLLADVYSLPQEVEPFAFRILAAGPMDGYGVSRNEPYLNQRRYERWVRIQKVKNEGAKPSIPWPFRWEPVRDQCLLLSDMEADPNFSIYTSVFLTTGAGMDYRGGTTLYVDEEDSTLGSNRRSKIQRGLVIDGSEGRVVVSTGGLENKRCRLPLREGLRIELQIWWDSAPSD